MDGEEFRNNTEINEEQGQEVQAEQSGQPVQSVREESAAAGAEQSAAGSAAGFGSIPGAAAGQTSSQTYTHTGAYAEASYRELSRAAKQAKKQERRQRKDSRRERTGRRGSFWRRAAAAVICGVLFGGITAGSFIGVLHVTGYLDRLEQAAAVAGRADEVLKAADQVEEYVRTLSDRVSSGTAVNAGSGESENDVQAVYDKALPAIVAITNLAVYQYNYGFYTYEREVPGSGSGIIIGTNEKELLIVTNYHVVENANTLTVTFVDGEAVEAYIKGTAEENDLAVVAVMLDDMKASTKASITVATLGSEDEVRVGQKVEAIGNALGYGQVMTVGYISAVDRQVTVDGKELTLLQTDAAINPGNSGGALLNMNGEVIGINSAKYSDTDVEGMGFAIPISRVREIIDELMTQETMVRVSEEERGYLGVRLETQSNPWGWIPEGAVVGSVDEGTPAAEAGIRTGDVITALDGRTVSSGSDLQNLLSYYRGGTTVKLTVARLSDGQYRETEIEVVLGFRKDFVQE